MSRSYREDCNDAKAVRRGIAEQRPASGKNGKARPVIVESRWLRDPFAILRSRPKREWRKYGAYRTEDEARTMIANATRKYGFLEFRIRASLPTDQPTLKD
jgi:hypothetical protein